MSLIRFEQAATALEISRVQLSKLINSGDVPKPDAYLGRIGGWHIETLRDWFPGISERLDVLSRLPRMNGRPPFMEARN